MVVVWLMLILRSVRLFLVHSVVFSIYKNKKRFSTENRFFITFLSATSLPFQASAQPKQFDHQQLAFHRPVPVPVQATIQYILKLLRHTFAH